MKKLFSFSLLLLCLCTGSKSFAQSHEEVQNQMLALFNEGKLAEAIPYAIKAKELAKQEYGDTSRPYLLGLSNLTFLYEKQKNYSATEPIYLEIINIRKKMVGEDHPAYAVALNDLGNAYYASEKYKEAEPYYKRAANIQRKWYGSLHPEFALIAKHLGNTYYQLKQNDSSIVYFEAVLAAIKKSGEVKKPEYRGILESLAILKSEKGDFKASLVLYQELEAAVKEATGENNKEYAGITNMMGRLYLELADLNNAEIFFRKSMELSKKLSGINDAAYAQGLNNMGAVYRSKGDFKNARGYYEEALIIRKKLNGEDEYYAQTLNNIAELYSSEGNYPMAESLSIKAIAIRKNISGEENEFYALNLNNLAAMYADLGKNSEAETLHLQVMKIRKKLFGENHLDYAQTLNNIALVYDNMGRYAEAERDYLKALTIRKMMLGTEHPLYAQTLNNLGALYSNMGRYAEAEQNYLQALGIRKRVQGEEHPDYAQVLDNLASTYAATSDYKKAEPIYQQALAIRKRMLGEMHPDYANSLSNLGVLYLLTDHFELAQKLFRQMIDIYVNRKDHPELYAKAFHSLAELYRRSGDFKNAEIYYQKSLMLLKNTLGEKHPDNAYALLGLGVLKAQTGNYTQAENLLDSSITLMFDHVQNNFINLSESEKIQWWDEEATRYQMAPSLLVSNPNYSASFLKKTFARQMQLKGLILNDGKKMLEQVRKNGNPELKSLLSQWQTNKATLASQYSMPVNDRLNVLDSLEKATTALEKQINQRSADFRLAQIQSEPGFEEIRHALHADEAAIEFIRFTYFNQYQTDSVLYAAFIVKPGLKDPKFIVLCSEKKLASLLDAGNNSSANFVATLYRGLDGRSNTQSINKSDSLHKLVWLPIQTYLEDVKTIHLAPAGLLNRVAFNALASDSGKYLIDRYHLRQYTSIASVTDRVKITESGNKRDILLYGGVDFEASSAVGSPDKAVNSFGGVTRSGSGSAWASLSGTLTEVKSIKELCAGKKIPASIVAGAAATEESFKALSGHSPGILHLSTHGFSLPDASKNSNDNFYSNAFSSAENPLLRSGIILAGANNAWKGGHTVAGKEDGILTAYEIASLDLGNTNLVVLSACETALGDIRGTEGVFGLQRAFRLAGVKQMVLSLWQVPDKETIELMTLFYNGILTGIPPADALNQAQQTMRKKYPVYYWAAFVLIQ